MVIQDIYKTIIVLLFLIYIPNYKQPFFVFDDFFLRFILIVFG